MIIKPFLTNLKQISNPRGDIYHALKASDEGFAGFGEAYFSTVTCGQTKGWKKHSLMQMNLIVPSGKVCFFVVVGEQQIEEYVLGLDQYTRLTVPPGFWFAFRGIGANSNLVLNIASIEHDPTETEVRPIGDFELPAL